MIKFVLNVVTKFFFVHNAYDKIIFCLYIIVYFGGPLKQENNFFVYVVTIIVCTAEGVSLMD